jgi:hypothetical protein
VYTTPVWEFHAVFKIPYAYGHVICRAHAEVILSHENPDVSGNGQGEEARYRKYKSLNLAAVRPMTCGNLPLEPLTYCGCK